MIASIVVLAAGCAGRSPASNPGDGTGDAGVDVGADAGIDAGGATTTIPPTDLLCEDGWCWQTTDVTGHDLTNAWATADGNELWVGGAGGTLLHEVGGTWNRFRINTPHVLEDGTTLLEWSSRVSAIWGLDAADVWVAFSDGHSGAIAAHWDGVVLTGYPLPQGLYSPHAMWGSASDDVWAMGTGEQAAHWDGVAWTLTELPFSVNIASMWGTARDDVWAVGNEDEQSFVARFDGTAWRRVEAPDISDLTGISGTSLDDVWITGGEDTVLRWDGSAFTATVLVTDGDGFSFSNPKLLDVQARTPDEAWIVDSYGGLWRWDGVEWGREHRDHRLSGRLTVPASGQPWIVGRQGAIFRRSDEGTWLPVTTQFPAALRAIWGADATHVWAAGEDGVLLGFDGAAWSAIETGVTSTFNDIHGTGQNDVWVLGDRGESVHWDGSAWSSTNPSPDNRIGPLPHLWALTVDDVWIAGWQPQCPSEPGSCDEDGAVHHWDRSAWSSQTITDDPLGGVWAAAADDVWVVGHGGYVARYDGLEWIEVDGVPDDALWDVWGADDEDVWSVGIVGLWHWDGVSWAEVRVGSEQRPFDEVGPLYATQIFGVAADDVWFTGGAVTRWDGSILRTELRGVHVNQLWASVAGDVWITVPGGVLYREASSNR